MKAIKDFFLVRYHFEKHGQVYEMVNGKKDLFDDNIFQKIQDILQSFWSHFHVSLPFNVFI